MFDSTLKRALPALVVAGSIVIGITGIAAANPLTDRQADPTAPTLPADPDSTKVDPAPDPAPPEKAPPDSDEEPAPDKAPTPEPAQPDPEPAVTPEPGVAQEPGVVADGSSQSAEAESQPRGFKIWVTAESVVATANVRTYNARRITVDWGDGKSDTRTASRLPTFGGGPSSLDFTQLKHAYDPPADGSSFAREVTVTVEYTNGSTSSETGDVRLRPRYQATVYTAFFRPLGHCDGFWDLQSEFLIEQSMFRYASEAQPVAETTKHWDIAVDTRGDQLDTRYHALSDPESKIRTKTTVANWAMVGFRVFERDSFVAGSSNTTYVGSTWVRLDPQSNSRRVVETFDRDGCRVELRFDYETRLLLPGLGGTDADDLIAIN